MGNLTIRNLPDSVHDALRTRAASHERSTEAEIRAILIAAVSKETGTGLGQQLRSVWAGNHGREFEDVRDRAPASGATFE